MRQATGERAAGSPRPTENEALRERQRDSVSADDDAQRRRRTPVIADQTSKRDEVGVVVHTKILLLRIVKRSIIINGSAINTRCTVLCAFKLVSPFKLVNHQASSEETVYIVGVLSRNEPNRRWRSRSWVRGRPSNEARGRVGFSTAAWRPARAGPPRCTLRAALGGALAPSAGPLCAAHLAYSQPIHTGPCRMCVRPPRENPPNDRLHPTHDPGHRVPPTPDHRPSRPRPDASISVGSEGVRLTARARPLSAESRGTTSVQSSLVIHVTSTGGTHALH